MNIAMRYTKNNAIAKDVFLVSFEKIFRRIGQYDPAKGEFKSWITRITINEAITHYKRELKFSEGRPFENYNTSVENGALDRLEVEKLYAMIKELPYPYGIIFNMVVDGYKHQEISKKLGIKESTSRSYFHRSRQLLQHQISKLDKTITIG